MAFPTDPIYKFYKDSLTDEVVIVRKSCGGGVYIDIPFNEENTHYLEYLEWAKTNTTEAAD